MRKALNVTLRDNSNFQIFSSSFDDENFFITFSTSTSDFLKILLTKSESKCDDINYEIALVDANHELKIYEANISKLRAQKDAIKKKLKIL